MDQVNPYELATPATYPSRHMRSFIAVMFAAMVMESHDQLKDAWSAIVNHRAYPAREGIVTAADVTDETLREMLVLFDAMPSIEGPDGDAYEMSSTEQLGVLNEGWLRRGWRDAGLWPADASSAQT